MEGRLRQIGVGVKIIVFFLLFGALSFTPVSIYAAESYRVGAGGDYSTLSELFLSKVLASGDEVILLGDDNSLKSDDFYLNGARLPRGITIKGQDPDNPVTVSQTPGTVPNWFGVFGGKIAFENIIVQGTAEDTMAMFGSGPGGGLDLSGSSNATFDGMQSAYEYKMVMDSVSNVTFSNARNGITGGPETFSLTNSRDITFKDNAGRYLIIGYSQAKFENLENVIFSGNSGSISASAPEGGQLLINNVNNLSYTNNDSSMGGDIVKVTGSQNILFANSYGALSTGYGPRSNAALLISDNKDISFIENYGMSVRGNSLTFRDNEQIDFINNTSTSIYAYASLKIEGTGAYSFLGNSSNMDGGVIFAGSVSLGSGATYIFENNSSTGKGGVIYSPGDTYYETGGMGHIAVNNAVFKNNSAINSSDPANANGGVLYSTNYAGTSNSQYIGNTSSGKGGAIAAIISNNVFGMQTYVFVRNSTFTGNSAGLAGGAIYTDGDVTLSADLGKSTIISGNTSNGMSDGIYFDTDRILKNYVGDVTYTTRDLTVTGDGMVRLDDSVRAVGQNALHVNKTGTGNFVWGNQNYFSNGSKVNFQSGSTTLSNNFSVEAAELALHFGQEHSLYVDLIGRDADFALFGGLKTVTAEVGSVISFIFDAENAIEANLGRWLMADDFGSGWNDLMLVDVNAISNGVLFYGAYFEVLNGQLWVNLENLRATPIPASLGLLGFGVWGLARLKRRFADVV